MSRLKFEPSDFATDKLMDKCRYNEAIAYAAQKKFDAWLDKQPVVYGQKNKYDVFEWGQYNDEQLKIEGSGLTDTHSARLVDIQELKKESCAHQPNNIILWESGFPSVDCLKCGVKLKARWEAE